MAFTLAVPVVWHPCQNAKVPDGIATPIMDRFGSVSFSPASEVDALNFALEYDTQLTKHVSERCDIL